MNNSDTRIAVCGLPRSGNRLIQRMLQRHGFVAEVRHYGMRLAFRSGGEDPDLAVWPVRDSWCNRRSCDRDFELLPKPQDWSGWQLRHDEDAFDRLKIEHYMRTVAWLAETHVLILPVSYEEIVRDPESAGPQILEFAYGGVINLALWEGWGEEIVDGNAKWMAEKGTQ